jgi:hypothetical protein
MERTVTLAVLILGVALGFAYALRVCPKCGWEQAEDAEVCSHCREPLAGGTPSSPAEAVPEATNAATDVDGALADAGENILRRAQKYLEEEKSPLRAWILIRAGLPMAKASGRMPDPVLNKAERMELAAAKAMMTGSQTCPVCKGSGAGMQQFFTMAGERKFQPVPGLKCRACGGRGGLRMEDSIEDLQRRLTGPLLEMAQAFKGMGMVQVSGIWVPAGVTNSLTVKQKAALLKASASGCQECYRMGGSGCRACKGSGLIKCSASSCEYGMILCPDCQGRKESSRAGKYGSSSQTCRTCNQKGLIKCKECQGLGVTTCEECQGTGREACAACGGTGLRPECAKCDGSGLVKCSRCKGSGEYRNGICPECLGQKQRLCTSCGGTGHGRSRR